MSASLAAPPRRRLRLSWSDARLRGLVWQVLILGAVALLIWYLARTTAHNLATRHIATGFAFLDHAAPIPIGETLIDYTPSVSSYGRALLIGVLNTLKISIVGCLLATLLGTLIGIGRLAPNWLLARLCGAYVEGLRDIPVLLQLLFWYGLMQTLPAPRRALHPLAGVFLSNRGLRVPALAWRPGDGWVLAAFAIGLLGAVSWARHAARRRDTTGQRLALWPSALLVLGLPAVAAASLGAVPGLDMPALHGFNFRGGLLISPEYAALLIGLVVYSASYIAEIVRSGILSVSTGQWEAAQALGLRRGAVLRLVVLPQALRVVVPPMTSQYLNLVKNSSLAVAVGYQDIVSIANTTLNQTGQAIEGIALIMAVYLTISLSISLFMNWYNVRIALVER
jgi:general L-amino acid transport system permease protein